MFEPVITEEAKKFVNQRLARNHAPGFPKFSSPGTVAFAVARNIDRELGVPDPPKARRRMRRVTAEEEIAQRVFNRQRDAVILFLRVARLRYGVQDLVDMEARLAEGNDHSCKHAAFGARNLMESVGDRLFPPSPEPWRGRDGRDHSVGAKDFKNRLIAYAEWALEGTWEGHEFQAFVATMDTVFRWTGSGPHGAYAWGEAEHAYTRMLDGLAVLAWAFSIAPREH